MSNDKIPAIVKHIINAKNLRKHGIDQLGKHTLKPAFVRKVRAALEAVDTEPSPEDREYLKIFGHWPDKTRAKKPTVLLEAHSPNPCLVSDEEE